MLGETTGTAAGGAAEEGKFLRVPGTNPFFPLPHDLQGNRFLGCSPSIRSRSSSLEHGERRWARGGRARPEGADQALVGDRQGDRRGHDRWEDDPDFGYKVARHVRGSTPGRRKHPAPRELYEAQGASRRVRAAGRAPHRERREFLSGFESLTSRLSTPSSWPDARVRRPGLDGEPHRRAPAGRGQRGAAGTERRERPRAGRQRARGEELGCRRRARPT